MKQISTIQMAKNVLVKQLRIVNFCIHKGVGKAYTDKNMIKGREYIKSIFSKKQVVTLCTILLFTLTSLIRAQVIFDISDAYGYNEATVVVTTKNFTNLTYFQYGISYNPDEVKFKSLEIIATLPGFEEAVFNTPLNANPTDEGQIRVAWDDVTGATQDLPDGEELFAITFSIHTLGEADIIREHPDSVTIAAGNLMEQYPVQILGGTIYTLGGMIQGYVAPDGNADCIRDANEEGFKNSIVKNIRCSNILWRNG